MAEEKWSMTDLRKKSDKELTEAIQSYRRKIMALNIDSVVSKEGYKNHARALYRRLIARVMTVMSERRRGV